MTDSSTLASIESEENQPPGNGERTFWGPALSTGEVARIVIYCAEEVKRQQRFAPQVGNMVDAWMDALNHQYHGDALSLGMIRNWGCLIEPTKNSGFRTGPVYINMRGMSIPKVPHLEIEGRLNRWRDYLDGMEALEAYREFEEIHPFWDGNGRTGKIILNWHNGTLLEPIFPPDDFWGERITNP